MIAGHVVRGVVITHFAGKRFAVHNSYLLCNLLSNIMFLFVKLNQSLKNLPTYVKKKLIKQRATIATYRYRLIVFVNNKKKKEIDIVPTSWITRDESSDTLWCKYMPPPYDNKKLSLLPKMIINCDEPLDKWLTYVVDVRGKACKYWGFIDVLRLFKT